MSSDEEDVLRTHNGAEAAVRRRECEAEKATLDELKIGSAADENRKSPDRHHPVFRTISLINGKINRMDFGEMKRICRENNLNNLGNRTTIKRRLKEFYKTEKLVEAGLLERKASVVNNMDFFVVIDFEATCEEKNPQGYPHEIIEFPAVLVSTSDRVIVDVFHSFVRPVINPVLSEFCRTLTGIDQSVVDGADPFPVVHQRFVKWLENRRMGTSHTFTVVTDGPFDMGRFLYLQTKQANMPFPMSYAGHWVNIRKCFASFYKGSFDATSPKRSSCNKLPALSTMLDCLGLEFEGSPHSGLDDARNIARILVRLLQDNAFVRVNEKIVNVAAAAHGDGDNRVSGRLSNVSPVTRKDAEKFLSQRRKQLVR